jgi:hypothetical protein
MGTSPARSRLAGIYRTLFLECNAMGEKTHCCWVVMRTSLLSF